MGAPEIPTAGPQGLSTFGILIGFRQVKDQEN
jgi:hypothetical protein